MAIGSVRKKRMKKKKRKVKKKRKEVHGHPLFVFHTVFQTLVHLQLYLGVPGSLKGKEYKIKIKSARPPAPIFFPFPDDKLFFFDWPN